MEMVWCPPGRFLMGSPQSEKGRGGHHFYDGSGDHEHQHEVVLTEGFWIGKYEVTQRQWKAIMRTIPWVYPPRVSYVCDIWGKEITVWNNDFSRKRGSSLPVDNLNWDDCQRFCQKLGKGFRLPTEAEWEYACRAGCTGPIAGNGILKDMGWFRENSERHIHPVGEKKPNIWGLCDMHGNVQEWCMDWYSLFYFREIEDVSKKLDVVIDPLATHISFETGHVIRGGGNNDDDDDCHAASRDMQMFSTENRNVGFRLVYGVYKKKWPDVLRLAEQDNKEFGEAMNRSVETK